MKFLDVGWKHLAFLCPPSPRSYTQVSYNPSCNTDGCVVWWCRLRCGVVCFWNGMCVSCCISFRRVEMWSCLVGASKLATANERRLQSGTLVEGEGSRPLVRSWRLSFCIPTHLFSDPPGLHANCLEPRKSMLLPVSRNARFGLKLITACARAVDKILCAYFSAGELLSFVNWLPEAAGIFIFFCGKWNAKCFTYYPVSTVRVCSTSWLSLMVLVVIIIILTVNCDIFLWYKCQKWISADTVT